MYIENFTLRSKFADSSLIFMRLRISMVVSYQYFLPIFQILDGLHNSRIFICVGNI